MAIIIQEEKKQKGVSGSAFFTTIIIFAILGLLGGTAYYLFFSPAPAIDTVDFGESTAGYKDASILSNVNLDVESVTGSDEWKALKDDVVSPIVSTPPLTRKTNPFSQF